MKLRPKFRHLASLDILACVFIRGIDAHSLVCWPVYWQTRAGKKHSMEANEIVDQKCKWNYHELVVYYKKSDVSVNTRKKNLRY